MLHSSRMLCRLTGAARLTGGVAVFCFQRLEHTDLLIGSVHNARIITTTTS